MTRALIAIAVLAHLSATAAAQSPLAPPESWPSEVFETAGDGIAEDSQNDRAVIATTAQIQPARSITAQYDYIHVRSLFGDAVSGWVGIAGIKVGVTERLQLSVQSSVPRDTSVIAPGFKYQLVRRDRFQVAGYGMYMVLDTSDLLMVHGAVASRCLEVTCAALVSANVSLRTRWLEAGELAIAASLLLPVIDRVKLVGEVELANIGLTGGPHDSLTANASYGLRFYGWGGAATLSAVKPLDSLGGSPSAVWATASYRY